MQLVKLLRAGEPVKMSKRSGEFVTLREVVDEVGRDAVRFDMLFRKNDAALDFDLAKVIEASRRESGFLCAIWPCPSPVGFPQRAGRSTRFAGGRRKAGAVAAPAPVQRLGDPAELSLLRRIALFRARSRRPPRA